MSQITKKQSTIVQNCHYNNLINILDKELNIVYNIYVGARSLARQNYKNSLSPQHRRDCLFWWIETDKFRYNDFLKSYDQEYKSKIILHRCLKTHFLYRTLQNVTYKLLTLFSCYLLLQWFSWMKKTAAKKDLEIHLMYILAIIQFGQNLTDR